MSNRCKSREDDGGETDHCIHVHDSDEDLICCWCGDLFEPDVAHPRFEHGEYAPAGNLIAEVGQAMTDEALRLAQLYRDSDDTPLSVIASALLASHADCERLNLENHKLASAMDVATPLMERQRAECARLRKALAEMRSAFKAFNGVVARIDDIIGKECA